MHPRQQMQTMAAMPSLAVQKIEFRSGRISRWDMVRHHLHTKKEAMTNSTPVETRTIRSMKHMEIDN